MRDPRSLDQEREDLAFWRDRLGPEARLLWTGRAIGAPRIDGMALMMWLAMAAMLGSALFARAQGAPLWAQAVFAGLGLVIPPLMLRARAQAFRAARYALTPQAALVWTGRALRAWPLDAALRPRLRRGSPGSIRFAPHPDANPDGENDVSELPGFLRIPDAEAVMALISAHGGAPAAIHSRLRSER